MTTVLILEGAAMLIVGALISQTVGGQWVGLLVGLVGICFLGYGWGREWGKKR